MDFKLFGSILLIVGTSIGAGMLALPIATAEVGFHGAVILLIACWFIMTYGALLLLEVNLWLPLNSNIISMAKKTLGPFGQILAWGSYLLLLYALLSAYIAGGSDLFHALSMSKGLHFSKSMSSILFTVLLGSVVFLGIRMIDYTNRVLMLIKFSAYFLLAIFLAPYISVHHLADGDIKKITSIAAIMVTITSFGYAPIIPSLRIYFAGDIKKLKKAIFIGSLVPLLCYIVWDAVIMGVVPLHGHGGLQEILNSTMSNSDLVRTVVELVKNEKITFFFKLFTSICILTSFLGVSLCLTDFLADAFQLEKKNLGSVIILSLTYFPPLLLVLFFPGIFIKALEYAGIYCVVLLMFLPAWMCYVGRYHLKLQSPFQAGGGKGALIFMMVVSLILIAYEIYNF